jgi:membrane-bound lytic murein transglycosylase A
MRGGFLPSTRNGAMADAGRPASRYSGWLGVAVAVSILLFGCAVPKEPPPPAEEIVPLIRLAPTEIPDLCDDLFCDSLTEAAEQSLRYLRRISPSRRFVFGEDEYDAAHMVRSLEAFVALAESRPTCREMRRNIRERYRVYRAAGREETGKVLFTGYYEPLLMGSLEKSAAYPCPVYTRPDDLLTVELKQFGKRFAGEPPLVGRLGDGNRVVPYYDRKEIVEQHRLKGHAEPLVWLKSRVDRFFLEIQGSGKVYLEGGGVMNVHYHAKNGRPYRSIGALLINSGKIARADMSMQSIRAYLEAHPDEVPEILNHNPSFVFFKAETEGPLGALGVRLTPGRSLALDRTLFPDAALAFIAARKPMLDGEGRISSWQSFGRFVFNQDTGGAIRGPGRADLFWGNGPYAEIAAGHMQHPGDLYLLVLRPDI